MLQRRIQLRRDELITGASWGGELRLFLLGPSGGLCPATLRASTGLRTLPLVPPVPALRKSEAFTLMPLRQFSLTLFCDLPHTWLRLWLSTWAESSLSYKMRTCLKNQYKEAKSGQSRSLQTGFTRAHELDPWQRLKVRPHMTKAHMKLALPALLPPCWLACIWRDGWWIWGWMSCGHKSDKLCLLFFQ